jgi:hypothetical protein
VLRVYELVGDSLAPDTLKNTRSPAVMLHCQRRRLEYEPKYFEAEQLTFRIQAEEADKDKMWLTDRTGRGVTLVDTSTLEGLLKIFGIELTSIGGKGRATRVVETSIRSRKMVLRDAVNGVFSRTVAKDYVQPVAIEQEDGKLLTPADRGDGVEVRLTEGIEVYGGDPLSASNRIWPLFGDDDEHWAGELRYYYPWADFQALIMTKPFIYAVATWGGRRESVTFGRAFVDEEGRVVRVDKFEQVELIARDEYCLEIFVDADVNALSDDFWIPNTVGGYNDLWVIRLEKNGAAAKNTLIELAFDEPYAGNNRGEHPPVFMDPAGNQIESATTDEQGEIRGYRFGFKPDERGRPGDVYRLKARVANMSDWVESGERDYLGVYDKLMLRAARSFCNDPSIHDWVGRDCEVDDPTITDAVAYAYGVKDSVTHFNEDLDDWRQAMNGYIQTLYPDSTWTTTLPTGGDWENYAVYSNGHVGFDPALNADVNTNFERDFYLCRRSNTELNLWVNSGWGDNDWHPKYWSGIDCAGLVQRCSANHTRMRPLSVNGGRRNWDFYEDNAYACSYIRTCDTLSALVGSYADANTYRKIAPGDLVIKNSHVGIVNYVTGERGAPPNTIEGRDATKIMLIQAHGGFDDSDQNIPGLPAGRVTDAWSWEDMDNENDYELRRLVIE